jgi:hypothetical protein
MAAAPRDPPSTGTAVAGRLTLTGWLFSLAGIPL